MCDKDHPRTRGEKLSFMRFVSAFFGSPPHTRGKDIVSELENSEIRITPAHAGKSGFFPSAISSHRDHPRTRGEKLTAVDVVQK